MHEVNKLHMFLVQGRLRRIPCNNGIPVALDPFLIVGPPLIFYNVNTTGLVNIEILQHKLILACQLLLLPIKGCIVFLQGWFVGFFSLSRL